MVLIERKKNTVMSQQFLFFRKTQRTKTSPGRFPHAEKPEKNRLGKGTRTIL